MGRLTVAFLAARGQRDAVTRVDGTGPAEGGGTMPIELRSAPSHALSIAPAIEYNLSARVGVIAGPKLTVAGRSTGAVVIPIVAVNVVL